jgi:hypothetical protein
MSRLTLAELLTVEQRLELQSGLELRIAKLEDRITHLGDEHGLDTRRLETARDLLAEVWP